jgi:hypothetical protein
MFSGIRQRWREARGSELRAEIEDTNRHLRGLGAEVNFMMALQLASLAREARSQFGPLENISADGKLKIGKEFRQVARKTFDLNMAHGYAYFIIAALYESLGLPGEDAQFAQSICAEYVVTSLEVERNFEAAEKSLPEG